MEAPFIHRVSLPENHTFITTSTLYATGTMKNPLLQLFPILWAVSSVFMAWEALRILTGSQYPILVVTSGSMEPAFQRGDLIFLSNRQQIVRPGDIPVIWIPGKPLPMVHRAITVDYQVDVEGVLKYVYSRLECS